MKTITIKVPDDIAERTAALKEQTGISEAALIRQAIAAGIVKVEEGMKLIHEKPTGELVG